MTQTHKYTHNRQNIHKIAQLYTKSPKHAHTQLHKQTHNRTNTHITAKIYTKSSKHTQNRQHMHTHTIAQIYIHYYTNTRKYICIIARTQAHSHIHKYQSINQLLKGWYKRVIGDRESPAWYMVHDDWGTRK